MSTTTSVEITKILPLPNGAYRVGVYVNTTSGSGSGFFVFEPDDQFGWRSKATRGWGSHVAPTFYQCDVARDALEMHMKPHDPEFSGFRGKSSAVKVMSSLKGSSACEYIYDANGVRVLALQAERYTIVRHIMPDGNLKCEYTVQRGEWIVESPDRIYPLSDDNFVMFFSPANMTKPG